jgi:cold shock protein
VSPHPSQLGSAFGIFPNRSRRGEIMASGRVKWFNLQKGFGFIEQPSGPDIFVHYSQIQGKGFKMLMEGETVTFDLVDSDKGPKAERVQRLRDSGTPPV